VFVEKRIRDALNAVCDRLNALPDIGDSGIEICNVLAKLCQLMLCRRLVQPSVHIFETGGDHARESFDGHFPWHV